MAVYKKRGLYPENPDTALKGKKGESDYFAAGAAAFAGRLLNWRLGGFMIL